MTVSEQVDTLQQRAAELKRSFEAAQAENYEQVHARISKAKADAAQTQDELKAKASQEAEEAKSRWAAMKADLAAKMDKLVQIQRYHTEVFAKFIDRLSKAKEADATVLDHSTIVFGSNMSNSDRHNNDPLPAANLGHANGKIKGGQHLKYPQDSRFADLLVTLFDRNNIPVEKLGDSGGILSEI